MDISFLLATIVAGMQCLYAQDSDSATGNYHKYNSEKYFSQRYAKASATAAFVHRGDLSWQQWQSSARHSLKQVLGITKIESSLPGYKPSAQLLNREQLNSFTREQWVIFTEPDLPLPMIVLVPHHKKDRLPLVVAPHGHGRNPRAYAGIYLDSADEEHVLSGERDIALQAVAEGYIAIAPTTRGFGETRTTQDEKGGKFFSCRIQLMHDLLLGRTPIGDRVWDIMKILDWAIDHLPVDTARIAITGNSAGGTTSLYAAAIDARCKVVLPASAFSTIEGSIGTIAHCDCNYIPGMLNWGNMSDVAGLIAPRPLVVIHGVKDGIYPIEETRSAFENLRDIYRHAGAGQYLHMYEGAEGHRYYKAGAWPFVHEYFNTAQP